MKIRVYFFAFFVFTVTAAYSQQNEEAGELAPQSDIVKVIVYSDRAIVERKAVVDLAAGEKRIVFDGLPENTESTSLQAHGEGEAVIQDIVYRTKYFSAYPDERIQSLVDAKAEKDIAIQLRKDSIERAASEKRVLEKIINKVTGQKEKDESELDPAKWAELLKFYGEKLAALDDIIRKAEGEIRAIKLESEVLGLELNQLMAGRQMKKNQAVVVLNVSAQTKAAVYLSYVVYGPTWQPVYDLRVDSQTQELGFSYKARVIQNTGEDWNNVELGLSTARPAIGAERPELRQWFVSLGIEPGYTEGGKNYYPSKPEISNGMGETLGKEDASSVPRALTTTTATVTSGAIAVMFEIPGKSSIASDNTSHKVSIMEKSLKAELSYACVPRLSQYAYLAAKVKNETDYPFLAGKSKVFLDGNFLANSQLSLVSPGEEFRTSLGVDEGIKVEHKLVKHFRDDQGIFEKLTRVVYGYEMKVTNNKKKEIEISVWDQIPVSTDQKIVVKLLDPSYSKDTDTLAKNNQNHIEWKAAIKPGGTKTVTLSYSVEYPVSMIVYGL